MTKIHLPKWSAMVVVGKKVTEDQAKEIIVRTSELYFSSNNHRFTNALYKYIFGIESDELIYHASMYDFCKDNEKTNEVFRKYGILQTEYLANRQIVSSYVGGPHGWCNWDGTIFANSFNIGKWPEVDTVYDEWKMIAQEFPYLDLKCQLYSKEVGEEENDVLVQFNVKDGKVEIVEPEDLYVYPGECVGTMKQKFITRLAFGADGECGCTLEEAIAALEYVENVVKERGEG